MRKLFGIVVLFVSFSAKAEVQLPPRLFPEAGVQQPVGGGSQPPTKSAFTVVARSSGPRFLKAERQEYVQAACKPGEQVTGGGYFLSNYKASVQMSLPTWTKSGEAAWEVLAVDTSEEPSTVTVFALCGR